MPRQITKQKADRLTATGEWMEARRVSALLTGETEQQFRRIFGRAAQVDTDNNATVSSSVALLQQSIVQDRLEYPPNPPRPGEIQLLMASSFESTVIVKVGHTLRSVTLPLLGIAGAIMSLPTGNIFSFVPVVAPSLKQIFDALVNAVEKIESPKEAYAVYTVIQLQGQLAVRDFNALSQRDFRKAFGRSKPSFQQVEDAIFVSPQAANVPAEWKGSVSRELRADLRATLDALTKRGILTQREDSWSLAY